MPDPDLRVELRHLCAICGQPAELPSHGGMQLSAIDATAALERTINLGAWDGSRLVGSIRVLTDGYLFATVPEIFVDPSYRRRGIGRTLMELALERAPRGKMAFGAQPQSVDFFENIGCERKLTGFVAARPLKAAPDAHVI